MSSKKRKIDKEKLKPIHERRKIRELIIKELKAQGPTTVPELSKATGLETDKVVMHMIALRQFGHVSIVGEKDDQLIYALSGQQK
ncbi:hypothetical protein GWO13_10945 [Candidatus Bathyarchaeota archaeon]|nr:hypothetical protein [Candidatus Bathyarchaeota archaeon]